MVKKCLIYAVMVTVFLLGCSVVEVGGTEDTYFPLAEGNTWVYEVSGERGVDTILCEMIELEPGVFSWDNDIDERYNDTDVHIFLVDGPDSGEPFDDSTKIIVDSLLGNDRIFRWMGVGDVSDADDHFETSKYIVHTPAGEFSDCLLVEGYAHENGNRFDVWFAPGIGPVQVYAWSDNKLVRSFSLIDFWFVQ